MSPMNPERNRIRIPADLKRKTLEEAREFRKNPTPSEAILWGELRGKRLNGIKFRRQQPIGPLIVDFYAPSLRLVVEVDGAVHEEQEEADQARQAILENLDLKVLRFSAEKVEKDIDSVLSTIALVSSVLMFPEGDDPHPRPLPDERGGEEMVSNSPHPQPLPDERGGEEMVSNSPHPQPLPDERGGEEMVSNSHHPQPLPDEQGGEEMYSASSPSPLVGEGVRGRGSSHE